MDSVLMPALGVLGAVVVTGYMLAGLSGETHRRPQEELDGEWVSTPDGRRLTGEWDGVPYTLETRFGMAHAVLTAGAFRSGAVWGIVLSAAELGAWQKSLTMAASGHRPAATGGVMDHEAQQRTRLLVEGRRHALGHGLVLVTFDARPVAGLVELVRLACPPGATRTESVTLSDLGLKVHIHPRVPEAGYPRVVAAAAAIIQNLNPPI